MDPEYRQWLKTTYYIPSEFSTQANPDNRGAAFYNEKEIRKMYEGTIENHGWNTREGSLVTGLLLRQPKFKTDRLRIHTKRIISSGQNTYATYALDRNKNINSAKIKDADFKGTILELWNFPNHWEGGSKEPANWKK